MSNLKYIYYSISCLLLLQASLFAQETIHLHVDKPLHILGDQVWFQAFLQSTESSTQTAQQLRVDLYTPEGELAARKRLKIENQVASGTFDLQLDWKEGWYTITAYTVWGNYPTVKSRTTLSIPVFNDFKERTDQAYTSEVEATMPKVMEGIAIKINTNKENYQRREALELSINLLDENGQAIDGIVSVAVIPKAEAELPLATVQIPKMEVLNLRLKEENPTPEELKVDYGQVIQNNTQDRLLGIGIHNQSSNLVQWQKPIEDGIFAFENDLTDTYQYQTLGLYASVTDKIREIEIQPLSFKPSLDFALLNNTPLPYSAYIETYLQKSRQQKKYGEIFEIVKAAYRDTSAKVQSTLLADKVYNTADFANMIDIEEFLKEVVSFVKLRKSKNGLTVSMLNENKIYYNDSPVYMIDGWLTFDQEAALNIPIKNITRIEIFRDMKTLNQEFGILGNNGVISFYTNSKQAVPEGVNTSNITSFEGISKPQYFSIPNINSSRTPDFRSLIYWTDSVSTVNGKSTISFTHSDDIGEFTIIVKALGANDSVGSARIDYKVE